MADHPVFVCLHLPRYRRNARGGFCKDTQPLPDWLETVRLPVFCVGCPICALAAIQYKVYAMALHFFFAPFYDCDGSPSSVNVH